VLPIHRLRSIRRWCAASTRPARHTSPAPPPTCSGTVVVPPGKGNPNDDAESWQVPARVTISGSSVASGSDPARGKCQARKTAGSQVFINRNAVKAERQLVDIDMQKGFGLRYESPPGVSNGSVLTIRGIPLPLAPGQVQTGRARISRGKPAERQPAPASAPDPPVNIE